MYSVSHDNQYIVKIKSCQSSVFTFMTEKHYHIIQGSKIHKVLILKERFEKSFYFKDDFELNKSQTCKTLSFLIMA